MGPLRVVSDGTVTACWPVRSAGGVVALFMSELGAGDVVDGRAAPVVVPGWLLLRGVTSRMPGGAAGLAGCVCAVWLCRRGACLVYASYC